MQKGAGLGFLEHVPVGSLVEVVGISLPLLV